MILEGLRYDLCFLVFINNTLNTTQKLCFLKTHLILPQSSNHQPAKKNTKPNPKPKGKEKKKRKKPTNKTYIFMSNNNNSKAPPSEPYTHTTTITTDHQPPHPRRPTEPPSAPSSSSSAEMIAKNEKARYNYLRSTIFCFTYGLAETLNSWHGGVRPRLFHEKLHTIRVEVADIARLATLEGASFRELCGRLEECLNRLEALNDVVRENLPCGWEWGRLV